ncbi:hypothetical protein CCHL11_04615 [Colletotrichum chlorophyti]|uniref:Uncharacterized protein n=1 Tax=Colletotrichum chlorophyti TaxID=708187 RepID=A0A1Q8RRE9_9PEZI|nr:hypothetical protein CCHL11_04615 [Colletotrichum chlorophyti]
MKRSPFFSLAILARMSLAVYCEASAYIGSGQPDSCTGQFLNYGNQSRSGTSPCFPAINGACGIVAGKDGGCNCTINFFSGGDCNRTSVGQLVCSQVGDTKQVNFDHFNIRCH